MFELGLGIVLAAWFVAMYFIYRKVFVSRQDTSWATPAINTPDTPQLEDNQPKLFLTAAELSAHHEGQRRQ